MELTDEALVDTCPVPPDNPTNARVHQAILVAAAVDGADVWHAEVKFNICMPGKCVSTTRQAETLHRLFSLHPTVQQTGTPSASRSVSLSLHNRRDAPTTLHSKQLRRGADQDIRCTSPD